MSPDFFILGGMKCGTTSLFSYLSQHPRLKLPKEKELHYYDIHKYRGQTLAEYLGQFPERGASELTGEATPFYLTHPHCPGWLKADFPGAKFIVVMRNPVGRFWSQYHQMKRNRHLEQTPEQIIAHEIGHGEAVLRDAVANPDKPVDDLKMCSLLLRGCYADQLERWFAHFDRNRFLLLFTEDLHDDRPAVVNRVMEFLGVEGNVTLALDRKHHTQKYSAMPDSLCTMLSDYYAPHNQRLAQLMGATLPWSINRNEQA